MLSTRKNLKKPEGKKITIKCSNFSTKNEDWERNSWKIDLINQCRYQLKRTKKSGTRMHYWLQSRNKPWKRWRLEWRRASLTTDIRSDRSLSRRLPSCFPTLMPSTSNFLATILSKETIRAVLQVVVTPQCSRECPRSFQTLTRGRCIVSSSGPTWTAKRSSCTTTPPGKNWPNLRKIAKHPQGNKRRLMRQSRRKRETWKLTISSWRAQWRSRQVAR